MRACMRNRSCDLQAQRMFDELPYPLVRPLSEPLFHIAVGLFGEAQDLGREECVETVEWDVEAYRL